MIDFQTDKKRLTFAKIVEKYPRKKKFTFSGLFRGTKATTPLQTHSRDNKQEYKKQKLKTASLFSACIIHMTSVQSLQQKKLSASTSQISF